MLVRLHIHNLALIERAELELAPGLNVLTGETGAGKTMLAQAIGLLTGAQPVAGMVGPYGDEAYVEAEFDAPADLFDDPALAAVAGLRPDGEDALVVARRLTAAGRSRAFVWGRGCARADLEALGERLIEMSSQHEARRLARPARQLELLDAHAGTGELAAEMAGAWRGLRAAEAALESARGEAADAARRRLDLEDLVARVDQLAPVSGGARRAAGRARAAAAPRRARSRGGCGRRAPEPGRRRGCPRAHGERRPGGRRRHGVRARAVRRRGVARRHRDPHPGRGRRAPRAPGRARGRPGQARARRGPARGVRPARAPVCGAARRGGRVGGRGAQGARAARELDRGAGPAGETRRRRRPRQPGTAPGGSPPRGSQPPSRSPAPSRPSWPTWGWLRPSSRFASRRPRSALEVRRPRGPRAGGDADAGRRAGGRDRIGRRALAHRAGDSGRRAGGRRAGDPAARRGRRGHRRPDGAGRRRQAGRAG